MKKPEGKCATCYKAKSCEVLVDTKMHIALAYCKDYESDWSKKNEEKRT